MWQQRWHSVLSFTLFITATAAIERHTATLLTYRECSRLPTRCGSSNRIDRRLRDCFHQQYFIHKYARDAHADRSVAWEYKTTINVCVGSLYLFKWTLATAHFFYALLRVCDWVIVWGGGSNTHELIFAVAQMRFNESSAIFWSWFYWLCEIWFQEQ